MGGYIKLTLYSVCGRSGNTYTCFSTKDVSSLKNEDQAQKRLLPDKMNKSFIVYDNIQDKLAANRKVWEEIQSVKPNSVDLLRAENKRLVDDGKKEKDINNPNIVWAKTLGQVLSKKYYLFEKMESAKFHIIREPSDTQSGAGYQKGSNYCVDLFYDDKGKLSGEIIRRIDAVNMAKTVSPFVPDYVKSGFGRIERIFIGDTLEINYDKNVFPLANTGAPHGRVFVQVRTFTEQASYFRGDLSQIAIFFNPVTRFDIKKKNRTLKSIQVLDLRKVIFNPIGEVVCRSKILKDK